MRKEARIILYFLILFYSVLPIWLPQILWSLILVLPIVIVGFRDYFQKKHSIRRNFPVVGHFRYMLELIRPEINQYFIESNSDGRPFSREQRSVVYQRAKKERDTVPFGTQKDVYEVGYEWVNHSIAPVHAKSDMKVRIGGPHCKQPYDAALLNISAMSYGALSSNAVEALNLGAKKGGFYHNTGEGSCSPYHLKQGGDVVWQVGTGYFGCRELDGHFSSEKFAEKAVHPNIKMIEIKLSQGAKPGHGGILPASKVSFEIAKMRGVEMGKDVNSPPWHTAFTTPIEMMKFIKQLRDLSGGKPIGFKLCVGKRREFVAVCLAMKETGIMPDFITVDGGEGGTGAAPIEFSNSVGCPLVEGLVFVHNTLVGFDLRKHIRVIASGKVTTGFDIVAKLSMGADICNSARGMMMAIGCIQALRCNSNTCPVGITTNDPELVSGLDIISKSERVKNFQVETVKAATEIMGAMGVRHSSELRPFHLMRRVDTQNVKHYGEIFDYLNAGDLLKPNLPKSYERAFRSATAKSFLAIEDIRVSELNVI